MSRFSACVALLYFVAVLPAQTTVVDLEDLSLPAPPPGGFNNGGSVPPLNGQFTSRGAIFNNDYNAQFSSWSGWAYSSTVDVTTAGFGNQYSAYKLPNGGGDASPNYAVAYCFSEGVSRITLPVGTMPLSFRITNNTYAALSMRDGDPFAKKFGGPTGNDEDFFLLSIRGRDSNNNVTGLVPFYLADYRFTNNAQDYIVSQWTTVDLSGLPSNTVALSFELESTDNGAFGMNTPAYFAMDNLTVVAVAVVPEPAWMSVVVVGGMAWWRRRIFVSRPQPAARH